MITYSGIYTPRHLINIGLEMRRLFGGGGIIQRLGVMGVIGVALIAIPIASVVGGAPASVLTWIPLGIIALGLVTLNEWGVRRALARGPLANQPVSGSIGPDGFEIVTPHASSTIAWAGLRNYLHRGDYLLLVDQSHGAFGVAADFFATPADFIGAVDLVRHHVIPAKPTLLSWGRIFRLIIWVVMLMTIFLLWSLFNTSAAT